MDNQIIVNNILLSYNKSGQGEHNLIFLHGWRSSKEVWKSVCQQISQSASKPVSCFAIDLPGFGKSPKPSKDFTVGDYTEIVKGFIEKLELKKVIVVGHSFGGRVGIKLASNHREFVSKLVLVDSAGFALDRNKKSTMGFVAKLVRPFFKPKFMQGLRKNIYKAIGAEDYLATPELQKTFVNVVSEDLSEDMKKILCPTLIITGENDMDTPVDLGKRMSALIYDSKFITIANAGHFSFIDNRQDFLKFLQDFVS